MCITIAQGVLDSFHGGCEVIHANSLEKFRTDLTGVSRPHVLLYSAAPEQGLLELLKRSDLPFAVVTADPIDVVRDLMAEQGGGVCDAIRSASLHFSTLDEIALDRKAVVIQRSMFENDLDEIVRKLMCAVEPTPDHNQIVNVLSGLFPVSKAEFKWSVTNLLDVHYSPPSGPASFASLPPDDVRLVNEALGDFIYLGLRRFEQAKWGPKLFLSFDGERHALPRTLSMVGPARIVVFGPYIYLPVGEWHGALRFGFWNNFGQVAFRLDVFSDQIEFETDAILPALGAGEFCFVFRAGWPLKMIQVRMSQLRGGIDGDLEVKDVWLKRKA